MNSVVASTLACAAIVWIAAAAGAVSAAARGQDTKAAAERTVWDGIYTAEQARRGQMAYTQACAPCHADDLRGKETAPSLVEESFAFLWGDMPVGELLERIRKLMPSDRPGSLPLQAYRDIVAFILESNKFPAGQAELDADPEALRKILITTKRP